MTPTSYYYNDFDPFFLLGERKDLAMFGINVAYVRE